MRTPLLLGLIGLSIPVLAAPHDLTPQKPGMLKRGAVDLNAYRINQVPEYTSQAATSDNLALRAVKRDSYVDTATELVKSVAPDATFRVVDDHYVGSNGVAHVNFKQTANGIDIDKVDFNVNIARDGTVFSYGNSFHTGQIPENRSIGKRGLSDAVKALTAATSTLQLPIKDGSQAVAEAIEGVETYVLKGTSGAQKDPEAQLVYLVKSDGKLAMTWLDADNMKDIHGVVDWVSDATFEVFPWGVNDPDEGSRVTLTDPWDTTASEFGWLSDGTTEYDVTRGNNAIAQTNIDGGDDYLDNYRPEEANDEFVYDWRVKWDPASTYQNASVTQLFYTSNTYHDVLYDLGFTEAAGNSEAKNNGQGGKGADLVILNAQDGSGTNNANFATPKDGQNGRMRMYLWTESTPYRDCAFEAGVIIHEYTHGLSNRLTGGPDNANCLQTTEAGGMGEGWGDFMATAIRLKDTDTRETDYSLGAWLYNNPAGIRNYLYTTNLETNPYMYVTANTYNEVHDIGEIWATMLYEVMWNLIDKHGLSTAQKPEFRDGVPTDGKFLTMKLVMDGMALQPCNPNFVQARDAILDADVALTGGENQCEIWTAFAKRGLGDGAKAGLLLNIIPRKGSNKIPDGVC
ncbi:extracellular elastinolytic metallo proteinase [Xylariaceae sp. FL1272]|nr:extracellular elastinolytic metallo proteinase [Xylariaceae sp. FL1272]